MRIISRTIPILFGLFAACLPTKAQPGINSPLSLANALDMAVKHSYQLQADAQAVQAAGFRTQAAQMAKLPTASLNATYTRISDNVPEFTVKLPGGPPDGFVLNPQILNQYNIRGSVQEQVYAGLRTRNTIEANKRQEETANFDKAKTEKDVRLNVATAFISVYKLQQSLRLVDSNLLLVARNRRNVEASERQGISLKNDVLRVELQQTNTEFTRLDIETNLRTAEYNLATLLGISVAGPLQLDTSGLFAARQDAGIGSYLAGALDARPELKAMQARVKANQFLAEVAKGASRPTLSVGANYYVARPNQRIFPQQDAFKNTWDAGITLGWNLTSLYTNRAQIGSANAAILQNRAQQHALEESVNMAVNSAYLSYSRSRQRIATAAQAQAQAAENYRITNNRYQNGTQILSDLLDAQVLLLQANINYTTARADAQLAWINLQYAAGKF
jgi:outer membrane protein TolC